MAQAKVWRHEIDQFCLELDQTAVKLKRDRGMFQKKLLKNKKIGLHGDTLENIKLQTRVYRDERTI